MPEEMKRDLLALLSPEQQKMHMARHLLEPPAGDVVGGLLLELAQTKQALEEVDKCLATEAIRLHRMAEETRATWQQKAEAAEKALAEARKDTERLDWWIGHQAYTLHKAGYEYAMVYRDSDIGRWHKDPRASIDAAKEGK